MSERIILIPPTHEQSVYSFHIEKPLLSRFVEFLAGKGLSPWKPPVDLDKISENNEPLVQVDVESKSTHAMMEDLKKEFLGQED